MTVDTRGPAVEPSPSAHWIRGEARSRLVFDLASRDLPYWRIGQRYGMTENAVRQFAWRNKGEIGELRAELLVGLRAACDGALQYQVDPSIVKVAPIFHLCPASG